MDNFLKAMEQQSTENGFLRKVIGDYTFRFGMHKNKTYDEVYENHKSYVQFVVTKLDYDKNQKLIDYYKSRIEEDYA
jgi:hypothetical protein